MKPLRLSYFIVAGLTVLGIWRATSWGQGAPQDQDSLPTTTNSVVQNGLAINAWFPLRSQVLQDSLVGWWKLNDQAGSTAADSSGNNLVGQLVAQTQSPVWTQDAGGAALVFDGRQNSVQVPNDPRLTPQSGLTIGVWIRAGAATDGIIVGKWSSGSDAVGSYTFSLVNGHPALELSLKGKAWPFIAPRALPADGQWHHVAVVYDGFEARLYMDSRRIAKTHLGGTIDVGNDPLVIGQLAAGLADVRLFNLAFTDGDIVLLYKGKPPLPNPALIKVQASLAPARLNGKG